MSITGALKPPAFTEDALCAQVDTEIFFPDKGESSKPAKRICRMCPVREECLAWAVATKQRAGIWGGKSVRELRKSEKESAAA